THETDFPTPEQPATLSLKDVSLAYPPSVERHEIDLSHYVTTSDNSPFKLTRVEALSSDAACQVVGQTDTQFYVAGDTKKACDYRYFAESVNGKSVFSQSLSSPSNFALVRLATTETSNDAQLPHLTHVTLKNTPVSVDLHAQFDAIGLDVSGWVLSETVTLPYNHGAQVDVDVANQTLTYTPESDFTGIDRILFSFTDAEQNPRLGQVDIAISAEANQGLTVKENIIYPTSVAYDKAVDIDISPYVISSDGDDYQLIYLQSFHADVTSSNPNDIYNKSFTFSSTTFGPNIVTFAVSDHKGAYAIGSMKIDVEGDTPWGDITHSNMNFLAPLTSQRADAEGIPYSDKKTDSDHPSLPDMALMTSQESESYCSLKGAEVATLDQWTDMAAAQDPQGSHHWPVQAPFVVNHNGEYYQAKADGTSQPLNGAEAKPMCVQSSYLSIVHNESDLNAVANATDVAKVAVRVTFNGEFVENKIVSASVSQGSSAQLDNADVTTDDKGLAVFELTNLKAERLTLTAEYAGKFAEENVVFVGDVNTATLALSPTVNNQLYSGTNEVTAVLQDAQDNPLEGYDVSFKAETHASSVKIEPQGNTNAYGKQIAKVTWIDPSTPQSDTTVNISAEFNQGVTPAEHDTNVTFKKHDDSTLGICGGQVNDTDKENAKGFCLKIAEIQDPNDNKTKWFTSTPTTRALSTLGYYLDDSDNNEGKSYADTFLENAHNGPMDGIFVRFKQTGVGGTQHERYCQNLADVGFAGRSDWRRPTKDELIALHNEHGSMWTNFGWPTSYYYWSDTPNGGHYSVVNLYSGGVNSAYPVSARYGSCVSSP
ncbi:DUF1566 domain-containing protein, partial [Vibrio parahaemolyticus]|nr:DUF1566 domain-containing protein [Vibrio parahaemolyticus]